MVNIREHDPRCNDSRVAIVCLKCSVFMIRRPVNTNNVKDIIENGIGGYNGELAIGC